jgi:hypothetical protein
MSRRSPTSSVRYHVLLYVIVSLVAGGCGGDSEEEPQQRAPKQSVLDKPGDSGTLKAKACALVSPGVVARAVGVEAAELAASPNDSLDLTICEWHGGPVRHLKVTTTRALRRRPREARARWVCRFTFPFRKGNRHTPQGG